MTPTHPLASTTCLGRTCLHWTAEGELEREDLHHVLARLAAVEGQRLAWPPGEPQQP
ncbi:MAG: hypothetical protein ACK6AD_12340 [Cyanobacteriota bacterium]|jgi:hypothetical protein